MTKRSVVTIVVVAVLAVGVVFFEPWTLFTSSTLVEAAPTAAAPTPGENADEEPTSGLTPPATPDGPTVLASGKFISQEHGTTGRATVIELPDGIRTLRLKGFATSNGPDLHVWLSDKKAGGNWFKYARGRSVKLGELKANRGSHNYEIPAGADLDGLRSVVIWCKRFYVSFGSAPLDL